VGTEVGLNVGDGVGAGLNSLGNDDNGQFPLQSNDLDLETSIVPQPSQLDAVEHSNLHSPVPQVIEMSSLHESSAPQTMITSVAEAALIFVPDLQLDLASHLIIHGSPARHSRD